MTMDRIRNVIAFIILALILPFPAAAQAQDRMKVVATFSILADMAREVGGERINVEALVGPEGDAHVFQPAPADARKVSEARLLILNGLGLEGWLERLMRSSGSQATRVIATKGIRPIKAEGDHDHGHGHEDDPHAWQSVANAKIYAANIRDGLIAADPAGRDIYEKNAAAYLARLDTLERDIKAAIEQIPPERRRIITGHDAFGYFAKAYGVIFIAPTGVSTETAASARDVARIIRQVKQDRIPAVFIENINDDRLMQQIARETGAKIGERIYSDALSPPSGPAATYIDMMRHNIAAFSKALR